MAPEQLAAAAWLDATEDGTLPDVSSFTRERVERVMAVSVAIAFVALGLQAFFAALGAPDVEPVWNINLIVLAFVPLVFMEIAFFVGRGAKAFGCVFVTAYLVVLALWPLATDGTTSAITYQPWIYFLVNVATVASVIIMPMPAHIAITVVTPLLYGLVRMVQLDFAPSAWVPVSLDSLYSLILGSVLLTLGWTFRSVARTIDERRVRAVSSYAQAAAANATERERVAVAALMHDSVLAALIAAERAATPRQRQLAVSMAREALTRLANTDRDVGEGSDAPVSFDAVVAGIRDVVADAGVDPVLEIDVEAGTPPLPGRVARALVLATAQAVSNAVEHADAVGLRIVVTGRGEPGRVEITVRDSGPGFDPQAIPADRLGIRASIIARVSAFGGETRIVSDADGTSVTLVWRSRRP